jgi:hypothetical protein
MTISTLRSMRPFQLLVALGATAAMSGGVAALAADDADAARCTLSGTQSQYACSDDSPSGPQP